MALRSAGPMARALAIPELLDIVFSFLDAPTNAKTTVHVCKAWSEISLDIIWKNLSDLSRLLRVLKPLSKVGDGKDDPYAWRVAPDAEDWKQVEKYTRRVRRLTFDPDDAQCGIPLETTVFEDVARTRTSLVLLPNLIYLNWRAPLALAVMFMHVNLRHFVLWLPEPHKDALQPVFRDITARTPNLTTLDVRTLIPMHDLEDDMAVLLASLRKLRKLVFPRFFFTQRIAETLAKLPDLGCIEFQYDQDQGIGDATDVVGVFRPKLEMGAFPSLWDVSITVTLSDALAFMNQPASPANLTAFYVDSQLLESPAVVQELLDHLAESCQSLETLGILTNIDDTDARSLEEIPAEERIAFTHLRSLLAFPNLTMFELIHQYPLLLTLEDVQKLAQSWPSLRKLILNNEPAILDESSLTLDALLPLARYCPELEHLGVFLNATADLPLASAYASGPTPYQPTPFAKLKRLSMGTSLISSDPGSVALFLSQICPLGVSLDCGVTWEHPTTLPVDAEAADRYALISSNCLRWNKVEELLPLLTSLRAEEREKTRLLTTELRDLRMRSSVLLDTVQNALGTSLDTCVSS